MNKNIGKILVYLTLIITTILWILAKDNFVVEVLDDPLIALNQISALLGTILFAWSLFLSTRLDFLENWFGGLDKVYFIHKKVSQIGFGLILFHPLALAIENSNNFFNWFLPVHQNSINLGVYSFWIFTVLIVLTLLIGKIKLPYHYWKFTHKFITIGMFLALLHIIQIKSDISLYNPLGYWMTILVGIGVASGIYKAFLYNLIGPKYKYQIVKIEKHDDIFNVFMKPINKSLKFKSGQFVYVSFKSKEISNERHPFCITSVPDDNFIRFSIKELGDFTNNLDGLKIGETALIWGPYGRIGELFFDTKKDAIFIGGGIGIAPFLSLFRTASKETSKRKTSLFYCTRYKDDARFNSELTDISKKNKNLFYHNQCSREKDGGHLTIEQILARADDVKNTIIYLCGPSKMMGEISKNLIDVGFDKKNIVLEDFEMI